mmetsp:Transcript_11203/g.25103  ORF Transcript_11203/g.25103 Transcript_11203/m.25103 type:complete len:355 (+) Transcript_11203:117-1181(+)
MQTALAPPATQDRVDRFDPSHMTQRCAGAGSSFQEEVPPPMTKQPTPVVPMATRDAGVSDTAFGHAGPFSEDGFFYKPVSTSQERLANETRMLELCTNGRQTNEPMSRFVPEYFGIVNRGQRRYIKLRDLLRDFSKPWLMDIKMGVRCYAEKELKNSKPRNDLYLRMVKMEGRMGREVLTPEERAAQAITKLRWMTLRDSLSSTQTLGFRVDAVVTSSFHKTAFESELFMAREDADVMAALRSFLPSRSACVGCTPREMACTLLIQLRELRQALMASKVFTETEFIGSSLFFAADTTGKVGVWMIDFNVTSACDTGLRHDIPWEAGNREDGYLIGLRNLERLWELLISQDEHWQ